MGCENGRQDRSGFVKCEARAGKESLEEGPIAVIVR